MTANLLDRALRVRNTASKLTWFNTLLVLVAVDVALIMHMLLFAVNIPPEAALSLQCGLLVSEGKLPFIDFFDVASPALTYLHVIPAAISKCLPVVHPIIVFNFCILVLFTGSTLFSARILYQRPTREQSHAAAMILCLSLLTLLTISCFGSRDHIFVLLFVPFLLTRWLTWTNQPGERRSAIIAGSLGGLAICLNHLYFLLFFAIELSFALSKMRFKPLFSLEAKCAYVVIGLFFFHFALFPAEYANQYFNWALPMVLCDYNLWDDRLFYVRKTPDRRDLIYCLAVVFTIGMGLRRRSGLIAPSLSLALSGLGIYIIQGRMLTEQALPMIYGMGMAASLTLSILLNNLKARFDSKFRVLMKFGPMVSICVLGLLYFGFLEMSLAGTMEVLDLSTLGYFGRTYSQASSFVSYLERDTKAGDKVIVLNDRIRPGFPLLLQMRRQPGSFLLTGYPIRMSRLLVDSNPEKRNTNTAMQFKMYDRLIKEIKSEKPKLIMLEMDSLGTALTDNKVMPVIRELYDEAGVAEWPDTENDPMYEYYAFRTALPVFKLKPVSNP